MYVLKRPWVDHFLVRAHMLRPSRARPPCHAWRTAGLTRARAPPSPPCFLPPLARAHQAEVGARFEVVVFTASLAKYADPLLDLLDRGATVRWRLFRESCYPYEGNYVKDLTCLGRELRNTIIVDNSPHSYIFQPFNAVPIRNFIDDMSERDLLDLLPQLLSLADVHDVSTVIADTWLPGVTPVYGSAGGQ